MARPCTVSSGDWGPSGADLEPALILGKRDLASGGTDSADAVSGWDYFSLFLKTISISGLLGSKIGL